ncbi:branched-chain amino acid ABC transporter permease [Azorhizobium oxalatiphilum]|uniref:Branched-chain amino acid ABC transporter permease n=1 Tax=Azorhizobium oxalatiphilum TaxID=980631 RepID=A0A917C6C3_9HYPH|nr:branched-chain amino acid ABC transporter permease [Azorhizobium oxalatiphilum]GGF70114.1 branched-chain amino acid ABC transporter permease [Azorhizobium oxalatiphilum]
MSIATSTPLKTANDALGIGHLVGRALIVLALLALIAAPLAVYPVFLIKILCFALFAAAFNLLVGYVGLLSFGHAAFFGGAAYITAHTVKEWGFTPELGILAGVAFAATLGLVMGFLAIRRQGIYFAMVTLALSQMVYFVFLQAPFTHSEDGIQSVPQGLLFGIIDLSKPLPLYYTVLGAFLLGMVLIWRVVNSPFGNILAAIRENEPRAISLGYEVNRYKLAAFVISAALAGLAGAVKAIAFQLASLVDVTWQMSGEVILMTLLGGIGTLLGPVVGAALVTAMEHYFAATSIPAPVLIGGCFVACVMLFRRGIVGEIRHRLKARSSR